MGKKNNSSVGTAAQSQVACLSMNMPSVTGALFQAAQPPPTRFWGPSPPLVTWHLHKACLQGQV